MSETTMLSYLSGLAANNNREWYHAHKAEYQEANGQFEALIQDLIFKIGETDGSILWKTFCFRTCLPFWSLHVNNFCR